MLQWLRSTPKFFCLLVNNISPLSATTMALLPRGMLHIESNEVSETALQMTNICSKLAMLMGAYDTANTSPSGSRFGKFCNSFSALQSFEMKPFHLNFFPD